MKKVQIKTIDILNITIVAIDENAIDIRWNQPLFKSESHLSFIVDGSYAIVPIRQKMPYVMPGYSIRMIGNFTDGEGFSFTPYEIIRDKDTSNIDLRKASIELLDKVKEIFESTMSGYRLIFFQETVPEVH